MRIWNEYKGKVQRLNHGLNRVHLSQRAKRNRRCWVGSALLQEKTIGWFSWVNWSLWFLQVPVVHYMYMQTCSHMQKGTSRTWKGTWTLPWVCTSNVPGSNNNNNRSPSIWGSVPAEVCVCERERERVDKGGREIRTVNMWLDRGEETNCRFVPPRCPQSCCTSRVA